MSDLTLSFPHRVNNGKHPADVRTLNHSASGFRRGPSATGSMYTGATKGKSLPRKLLANPQFQRLQAMSSRLEKVLGKPQTSPLQSEPLACYLAKPAEHNQLIVW